MYGRTGTNSTSMTTKISAIFMRIASSITVRATPRIDPPGSSASRSSSRPRMNSTAMPQAPAAMIAVERDPRLSARPASSPSPSVNTISRETLATQPTWFHHARPATVQPAVSSPPTR